MHDDGFQLCMHMDEKNSNLDEHDAIVNQVEGDPLEKMIMRAWAYLIPKVNY
mgnify:CR=1 FL=1